MTDDKEITAKEYQAMQKHITKLEMENGILKKSTVISKYTVKLICKVLKLTRSTYYKALNMVPSKQEIEAKRLKNKIREIRVKTKSRYGAPKIHKVLINNGESISLKRVQLYMADMSISSIVV